MDDIHSFHTRAYEKSADFEEQTLLQRFITLAPSIPILIAKLLVILCALIFELFKQIFYSFVPKPLTNIRGQLAVVTGGSNGIGREICLELARCGCNIACLDLDLDAAKQLCTELRQLGVKANAYKVDVTDPQRIEQVKREINADLGHVSILVNNAGLMPTNSFRGGDAADVRRVIDVNVLAHFWTTRTFIGDMIERRSGYIVGICSMIAFYPMSTAVSYTTSKFAVKGFMDALTRESLHENWGVKTLTVFPHVTNTRKEIIDYVRQKIPPSTLERAGLQKPIDVARGAVHALRTDAGYVAVPWFYLSVGKLYQSLPFSIQHFADGLIMPRVTSNSNYKKD